MLRLRPYKRSDASVIVSWCKDETAFRQWTSDRYDSFPITDADMNYKYFDRNGDCVEADNFYPMTAFDETGIVGHLIMRFTDAGKKILRLGFVIVDDAKRGQGYGKEMLQLAIQYAFETLKVEKVTLGVFENNPSAYWCYKAAGFCDIAIETPVFCEVFGERWNILELEITAHHYFVHK